MIIVMQSQASEQAIEKVINTIRSYGLNEHLSRGIERTIIGVVGDERVFQAEVFERLPEVERAVRILHDWRIISKEAQNHNSEINARGVIIGGNQVIKIQALDTKVLSLSTPADAILIDPFFTSDRPYEFQQHKTNQYEIVSLMRENIANWHQHNKPVVVRIRDVRQIDEALLANADILYLGGELMNNLALAEEIGKLNTPIVLCKDKHHRVDDWLLAAERIAIGGNHQIILGEAGTLTLNSRISFRLDTESIAIARKLSHLPVLANIINLESSYLNAEILSKIAISAGANAIVNADY